MSRFQIIVQRRGQCCDAVDQTSPVHVGSVRVRFGGEEQQEESRKEEAEGKNIDRNAELSQVELRIRQPFPAQTLPEHTTDADYVGSKEASRRDRQDDVESSRRADLDQG